MEKFAQTGESAYEAYGFTYEEVITNAALALFSHYFDLPGIGHTHTLTVKERGDSLEETIALAFDDLMSHSIEQGVVFTEFAVEYLSFGEHAHDLHLKAFGGIPEQAGIRRGGRYSLPTVSLETHPLGHLTLLLALPKETIPEEQKTAVPA